MKKTSGTEPSLARSGFGSTVSLVCLILICIATLRPEPEVHPPPSDRKIVDMTGRVVPVTLPFRGVAMTWGSSLREFYTVTRSPQSVLAAWPFAQLELRNTVLSDLFHRAPSNPGFWESSTISNGQGPNTNIETLLKTKASVFFGYSKMAPIMDRVGIPFAGGVLVLKEELLFSAARMIAGSTGDQQRGEELIDRYQQDFAELKQELQPESITQAPRVLMVTVPSKTDREGVVTIGGRVNQFWTTMYGRAGIVNAVDDRHWLLKRNAYATNVERLLALDPDIIILDDGLVENQREHPLGPAEFIRDPRFQAMRAARQRRVYRYPAGFTVNMFGIIETPLATRWLAEIAHPDRLEPRTRALVRQRVEQDLGIVLNDSQLDRMLSVDENRGTLHADRFEALESGQTGPATMEMR